MPLSTHPTSDGWVRYRRCGCGSVSVELLTLETCTAGTVAGPALRASEVHAGRV